MYGRYGNPSRLGLEATLAAMEGADHCLTFSSGMAASHAAMSILTKGKQSIVDKNGVRQGALLSPILFPF